MPKEKIYKCCICHKILNKKPIRLVKQLHNGRIYKNIFNYDFCNNCYLKFNYWVKKYEEVKDD